MNKECKNSYYMEHRQEILDKKREFYKENREELIKARREYYLRNRKQCLEYDKQYQQRHKEKIAQYKKEWRAKRLSQNISTPKETSRYCWQWFGKRLKDLTLEERKLYIEKRRELKNHQKR